MYEAESGELVDTKVFDALTNIINFDSTALAGPTAEQVAAREKIMTGKEVTEAEQALANTITPKEQAERNQVYLLFYRECSGTLSATMDTRKPYGTGKGNGRCALQ